MLFTFTVQNTSAFNVDVNGNVTNIKAGGVVYYHIKYKFKTNFTDSVASRSFWKYITDENPCDDIETIDTQQVDIPGGKVDLFSMDITGNFAGSFALALNLPATQPQIEGITCFDNEIALSVQPVFQNFDCEWTATPSPCSA